MDNIRMKQMLKEGYTPEYVSLIKWQELRRKILDGENYDPCDIGSSTYALCETVKPSHLKYGFLLFMLILLFNPGMGDIDDNEDKIVSINSLDNDRNQVINKSDYDNLSLFLSIDQTDKHEYLPWYTCGHYSRSLARNLSLFPEYSQYNMSIGSIILSNHPTMGRYDNHIMNYFIYQGEIWLIEPQTDYIYPLWNEHRFIYYRLYWDGTQVPTYWDGNLAHTGVIK